MDAPFTVINEIFKSAGNKNEEAMLRYFSDTARIDIDGKVISGDEFVKRFANLGCQSFSIDYMEVFEGISSPDYATFSARVQIPEDENEQFSGRFQIRAEWVEDNDNLVITKALIQRM